MAITNGRLIGGASLEELELIASELLETAMLDEDTATLDDETIALLLDSGMLEELLGSVFSDE